jgi:hypothetical protein
MNGRSFTLTIVFALSGPVRRGSSCFVRRLETRADQDDDVDAGDLMFCDRSPTVRPNSNRMKQRGAPGAGLRLPYGAGRALHVFGVRRLPTWMMPHMALVQSE